MHVWFELKWTGLVFDEQEYVAKQKEERELPAKETGEQDEIPLFYSDIMPLLVRKQCFKAVIFVSSK